MASRSLDDLNPHVKLLAETLLKRAAAAGIPLTVICTLRSMDEQAALYAQGRTRPGPIVTYARPGYSFHNFGLALDVVPTRLITLKNWGETPDYREEARAIWDQLGSIGVDAGFVWGGDFTTLKDRPHFEWSGGLSLAQLRAGARPPSQIPFTTPSNKGMLT
jgi:peptidoglycan L-alanyl-D-glutamate endopeptidase CwlK